MKSIVAALPLLFVFSRVIAQEPSPAVPDKTATIKIPKKAHDAMEQFAGRWKHVSTLNGQASEPGSGTRRWIANESALIMEGEIDGVASVAGITGWNPSRSAIVETWHSSDGITLEVVYPLSGMGAKRWLGTVKWGYADGKTFNGLCSIEFNEQGWEWTAHWEEAGEAMTRKGYTRRVQ